MELAIYFIVSIITTGLILPRISKYNLSNDLFEYMFDICLAIFFGSIWPFTLIIIVLASIYSALISHD